MTDNSGSKKNWLRILLIVSLALNLLVIGLMIGAALRFGGPDSVRHPPRSLGSALYRALPDDMRKEMRQHSRSGHEARRRDGFRDVDAIVGAMRAVPFDGDRLRDLMNRQLEDREKFHRSVQDTWFQRISSMTDTERTAYADRLEEVVRHRKSKHKKRD